MKELFIEIITPSKSAYKGNVKSVTVPGTMGNFQILFNHAPILSSLEIGRIKIDDLNDKSILYATSGGTVEVKDNKILLLADSVELEDEIDVERAQKAYQRAKDRLSTRTADLDVMRAELALQRAINRLKIKGIEY